MTVLSNLENRNINFFMLNLAALLTMASPLPARGKGTLHSVSLSQLPFNFVQSRGKDC
jgi:hypothetical protein